MDKEEIQRRIDAGNLIPIHTRPKEEQRLIAQKGGQTKSKLRNDGQKFRYIKQRILKDPELSEDDKKWIIAKAEERPAFGLSILAEIQKLKKSIHPAQRVALMNTEIAMGKFLHGEKIITENTNINLNMQRELSDDDMTVMKEFLERRKE